jgi:hypothetical protein
MKKAIFAVVLAVSVRGAFGQSTEMKRYVNSGLGFELSYPASYRVTDLPCRVARWFAERGFQKLLYLSTGTGEKQGNILLSLDRRPFNLATLERAYAHTGWVEPHQIQIGKHTFFYYGTGGGGEKSSDDYLYNLNGLILRISFDGPYPPRSKSPSEQTRQLEEEVLESFRLFAPTAPGGK